MEIILHINRGSLYLLIQKVIHIDTGEIKYEIQNKRTIHRP
jgi:hypothetical protein